jgi:hypothetical protein
MRPLVRFAVVTLVSFAVLHVLGFREDAGFLSGTHVGSVLGGVVYVLSYFAAVVAAPVAMIAAALLWVGGRSRKAPVRDGGRRRASEGQRGGGLAVAPRQAG